MSEQVGIVSGVHIFPIKSHQEATVDGQLPCELRIGATGFEHEGVSDRGWVVADENNLFVSQRGWDENQSRKHRDDKVLATLAVDIMSDHLHVSAAGHGELRVPLDTTGTPKSTVRIFGPELPVIDEGKEAAEFYSDLLGRPLRLVKADPARKRMLPDKYSKPDASNESAGADGRPFSLGSLASLDYLHDRAEMPRGSVTMAQYRTNLDIVGGILLPFFEDTVLVWRIGQTAAFYETKSLERCPMPNIDQKSGDDSERLSNKLLIPFRLGWALGDDQSKPAKPHFAQSLNHKLSAIGTVIAEGDPVFAEETGRPNFVPKHAA